MADLKELRVKFLKIYANIPEDLRKDILVVVEKSPYTWNTAYIEVKEDSELGKKILKILKEVEII